MRPVWRTRDELLVSTLFRGANGTGKTMLATLLVQFLLCTEPPLPISVLDAAGPMVESLWNAWCYRRDDLEADAASDPEAARLLARDAQRVRYLVVDRENSSGLRFNIDRRRPGESVKDRVSTLMGIITAQRAGAEDFNIVYDIAPSVLACLVAANRPLREMRDLLWPGGLDRWRALRAELEATGALADPYVRDAVATLAPIIESKSLGIILREFGSTRRMFRNLTVELDSYFERPTFDLDAHLDAGGVLLVRFHQTDDREMALMRRAVFSLITDHVLRRSIWTEPHDELTVIDEHAGLDPETYAGYVTRARNFKHHLYFLYQTGDQIGEKGAHESQLGAIGRRCFSFRAKNDKQAEDYANLAGFATIAGRYLPTRDETAGVSEQHGSQKQRTRSTASGISEEDPGAPLSLREERTTRVPGTVGSERQEIIVTDRSPLYPDEGPRIRRTEVFTEGEIAGVSTVHGSSRLVRTGEERVGLAEQLLAQRTDWRNLPVGQALVDEENGRPFLLRAVPYTPLGPRVAGLRERARRYHEADARALEALAVPDPPPLPALPPDPPRARAPRARTGSARPPEGTPPPPRPETADTSAGAARAAVDGPAPLPERDGREDAPLETPPSSTDTAVPNRDLDRATRLLAWALHLRYVSVNDFILLTRASSYDAVARTLEQLTSGEKPALDRFTPPTARGQGSAPALYTLNGHGARLLADAGQGDLAWMQGVARTVAKRRRDVEAGAATHLVHDTDVVHLAALVVRHIYERDPAADIQPFLWASGFHAPLPYGEVLDRLPAKYHELVGRSDGGQAAYWPDVFLAVRWRPGGAQVVSECFALEAETGFSGADGQAKGAVRAAKVGVIQKLAAKTGTLGSIRFPDRPRFRVLTWARTPEFEAGLVAGTRSVQRAAKNDMWFTNADLLPLTVPKGTVKRDIPATLKQLSDRLGADVWTWIRQPHTRCSLWEAHAAPRVDGTPGTEG